MIQIEIKDGLYHIRGPKLLLCLTKAEFIRALKRGKAVKRRQAFEVRQAPAMDSGATIVDG